MLTQFCFVTVFLTCKV